MKWLDWLFGRAAKIEAPREDEPLPPMRFTVDMPDRGLYVPPPPAPKPQPWFDPEEYLLEYSTGGAPARQRRVIFLLTSPAHMVTAIDLDQRRVRTYRLDRMGHITDPRTNIVLPAAEFFHNDPPIQIEWGFLDDPRDIAVTMLKEMLCQISLAVLIARTAHGLTPRALDAVMEYVQRDARFAVRTDFVPKGDKTQVWPILRDRVAHLTPRRDHLSIYVETLQENWENARRFTALNDALTTLCHLDGGPTAGQMDIARTIEALGRK